MKTSRRTLLASGLALPWTAATADIGLPVYTYHRKPPYLTEQGERAGLFPELTQLLGTLVPDLGLHLSYLPRLRIDAMLATQQLNGLVLGVSPLWFGPRERVRNLWTPVLMQDADLLISRREAPVRYTGPASLQGRRLALPRGYIVPGVNEAIASGRIKGESTETETLALAMLMLGRVDAAVVTRNTLEALLSQNPAWRTQVHVSTPPLGSHNLHIMVPRPLATLHPRLSQAVGTLVGMAEWSALRRRYLAA
jgi:polar amino acid transport system substrate-binding protein